jgi:hypothetical protein
MMSFVPGGETDLPPHWIGKSTVIVEGKGGSVVLPLCDVRLHSHAEVTSGAPKFTHCSIEARSLPPPGGQPHYRTIRHEGDEWKLARAISNGDYQAALALADEVQMQHVRGKDFVSREALEARLDDIEARLDGAEDLLRKWMDAAIVAEITYGLEEMRYETEDFLSPPGGDDDYDTHEDSDF